MSPASILLVFPEVGSGTSVGERYILEAPQHQYLKVYQHKKFNRPFGEDISVYEGLKGKHEHPAL
jgi:hypothetical protein